MCIASMSAPRKTSGPGPALCRRMLIMRLRLVPRGMRSLFVGELRDQRPFTTGRGISSQQGAGAGHPCVPAVSAVQATSWVPGRAQSRSRRSLAELSFLAL